MFYCVVKLLSLFSLCTGYLIETSVFPNILIVTPYFVMQLLHIQIGLSNLRATVKWNWIL